MTSPVIQLTQYQKDSDAVRARFRLNRWCRQTGKTFEDTREIAEDGHRRRTEWIILSRGERQSRRNMEQLAVHCRAYGYAADIIEDQWDGEKATYKSLEIVLPSRTKFTGLPANPDTARGFSANVSLDEFAFHKDSRKIWTSLFPTITRGYKIRISSTPQGKQNKFYELDTVWTKKAAEGDPHYHTAKVDIFDAVTGGLVLLDEDGKPTTPDSLKEALGDDEAWDQEYLVLYIDEATAFLSHDLIATCEDDTLDPEPAWLPVLLQHAQELHALYLTTKVSPPAFELLDPTVLNAEALALGMDIGRKRDLSKIWLNAVKDGVHRTIAVVTMRKTPFFVQKAVLFSLLAHPLMVRGCIDQTGLGMQLAEEAIERFGAGKVEGIDFTAANKELIAIGAKQKMEDGLVKLPAELPIRNSFRSVRKFATGTGHFRFDAERTEETGHADDFWAFALSLHAASASGPPAYAASSEPAARDWRRDRSEQHGVLAGAGAGPGSWRGRFSRIWGERS